MVPEEEVPATLASVFAYFKHAREPGETLGDFCLRKGAADLAAFADANTPALPHKTKIEKPDPQARSAGEGPGSRFAFNIDSAVNGQRQSSCVICSLVLCASPAEYIRSRELIAARSGSPLCPCVPPNLSSRPPPACGWPLPCWIL